MLGRSLFKYSKILSCSYWLITGFSNNKQFINCCVLNITFKIGKKMKMWSLVYYFNSFSFGLVRKNNLFLMFGVKIIWLVNCYGITYIRDEKKTELLILSSWNHWNFCILIKYKTTILIKKLMHIFCLF